MFAWQRALQEAVTHPEELIRLLALDPALIPQAERAARLFPLKVPRHFLGQIKQGDPADPLLRQILPLDAEADAPDGFEKDPLQESTFNPLPGLLHKYESRVLLTVTGACGINCRFCFRRNFPYEANQLGPAGRDAIFDYLSEHPLVTEVILSGGDPLVAPDALLASLSQRLADIPHIRRLRVHSRMPVVLPERITPALIDWMTATRLQPVMIVHCNHPNELSDDFCRAVCNMRKAGITVLNQSVLLRGVNDDADVLARLNEALFAAGIMPYYLHLPDKVQGAAHFDVSLSRAQALHATLSARLSGYLVPRLVVEIPGQPAKTLLSALTTKC